ncbi:MAG TPA: 1-pyrroline-5-carboxylate dehydrogenase [Chitinophagaceae bacterium]|nr:1-pyrroline-5-carboxylate dehydrogenase [Chitinophagaceae bacterium]
MSFGTFSYPIPANEPVKSYDTGSVEREAKQKVLSELKKKELDVPQYIGGRAIRSGNRHPIHPPHARSHVLGFYHAGDAKHVHMAIESALKAKPTWETMPWEERAAIFLKAADLIATKYRYYMNGTTMLGQSKNVFQAEIDSACELVDFIRFNVHFLSEIYKQQPISVTGLHNRMEWRALEGFVLAVTPFNFTAIGGNLPASAAMCGNVVVWKCANTQIYSAQMFMRILMEAGLPDGVINLVYVERPTIGNVCFNHPDFAGVHFTGSTGVFQGMWKAIGQNFAGYKSYPRIVGETGGKDFVMVHPSADVEIVATALSRGAFEYQGQKCSAASRAYIPSNLWPAVKERVLGDLATFKMGTTEDFSNFINAVIDEKAFDTITSYIEEAKKTSDVEIIAGGHYDNKEGYFIEPTIIVTKNPRYRTMCEEIFGPVLTVYVYDESQFEETLDIVNNTSVYSLTGSIIAQDRAAVRLASHKLRNAAGNFYINDKPTGAVVGQQPFGGARASGTNDKAGSALNLLRWVSARTIKENLLPPKDYRYPFLEE